MDIVNVSRRAVLAAMASLAPYGMRRLKEGKWTGRFEEE